MYLKEIDFEFLLCLEIATPVFDVTALASDALQNQGIDLSTAYSVVGGVMDTLSNLRTEEFVFQIVQECHRKGRGCWDQHPHSPPGTAKAEEPAKYKHSSTAATVTPSNQWKSTTECRCTIHSLIFFLRNYIGDLREMGRHSFLKYSVHSTV